MTDKLSDKLLIIPKRRRPFQSLYCHNSCLYPKEMKEESFPPYSISYTNTPIACSHKKGQLDIGIVGVKPARGTPKANPRSAKKQTAGRQKAADKTAIGCPRADNWQPGSEALFSPVNS